MFLNRKITHKFLDKLKQCNRNILIIKGDSGLGKTTLIEHVLNELSVKNVLRIVHEPLSSPLLAIYKGLASVGNGIAINEFSMENKNSMDISMPYLFNSNKNDLNFKENLMYNLIETCKQSESLIISIEDLQNFSDETILFIFDFMEYIFFRSPYKVIFIVEINSQNSDGINSYNNIIELFSKFTKYTIPMNVDSWTHSELYELFYGITEKDIIISESTLNFILSSSFGSPSKLKSIVEYLKHCHIIYNENNQLICKEFENELLLQQVGKYILERYEKMDPLLKNILKHSSIIGYEFDSSLLARPFQYEKTEKNLQTIEEVYNLIIKKIDTKYTFDTQESYLSIKNIVNENEAKSWNKILGEYFFEHSNYYFAENNIIKQTNCLIKSAFYYEQAGLKENVISIYKRLISLLMAIMDYESAIEVIDKTFNLSKLLNISYKKNWHLYFLKAECYRNMFRFEQAAKLYEKFLKNLSIDRNERMRVKCLYAISLYNSGEVIKPYEILCNIKNEISQKITKDNVSVYVKTLSYISSIEETLLEEKYIEHFHLALEYAKKYKIHDEYYELLRKSLIVHKGKNGIALTMEAKEYFEKINNKKELAMSLHNLATEMLLYEDIEESINLLNKSFAIFDSFANKGVHYVLNSLGCCYCLKGDFESAIRYFSQADSDKYEIFSRIGIRINLSTAYRKLSQFSKSSDLLNEVKLLFTEEDAEYYAITKPHLIICEALLAYDMKDLEKAYNLFLKYIEEYKFNQTISHHRLILSVKNLKNICLELDKPVPTIAKDIENARSKVSDRLSEHNITLARFLFAE